MNKDAIHELTLEQAEIILKCLTEGILSFPNEYDKAAIIGMHRSGASIGEIIFYTMFSKNVVEKTINDYFALTT